MEVVSQGTARLLLRNLRHSDRDAVAAYRCDAESFRYIGDPMSKAEVAAHVARSRYGWSRQEGEALHLAVEVRETGAVIGEVMARLISHYDRQAEFGVALHPRLRGQGFGSEALAGLFRYCFEEAGLHRLIGYTDVGNRASSQMVAALGLRWEGLLRHNKRRHGQWRDERLVAVVADEWPELKQRWRRLLTPSLGG
ncbi:MAG: GNAT family N-acetyltransferase [Micromonosporaceae bacterium]